MCVLILTQHKQKILNSLYKLLHVILITALGDRFYDDPHFTNGKKWTHIEFKKPSQGHTADKCWRYRPQTHVGSFQTLCSLPLGFSYISTRISPEMHTWLRATVLKLLLDILIVQCFPQNWQPQVAKHTWDTKTSSHKHHLQTAGAVLGFSC